MYFLLALFDSEHRLYNYASPSISSNKLHQLMRISVGTRLQLQAPILRGAVLEGRWTCTESGIAPFEKMTHHVSYCWSALDV
jgi:hypothetical protein